jgi:hypothetical protein
LIKTMKLGVVFALGEDEGGRVHDGRKRRDGIRGA